MNPTTIALLSALKEADEQVLTDVYGIGFSRNEDGRWRGVADADMYPLDRAILDWRAAGCPDAPEVPMVRR